MKRRQGDRREPETIDEALSALQDEAERRAWAPLEEKAVVVLHEENSEVERKTVAPDGQVSTETVSTHERTVVSIGSAAPHSRQEQAGDVHVVLFRIGLLFAGFASTLSFVFRTVVHDVPVLQDYPIATGSTIGAVMTYLTVKLKARQGK